MTLHSIRFAALPVCLLSCALLAGPVQAASRRFGVTRATSDARAVLELEGAAVGDVEDVDGGDGWAPVVAAGGGTFKKKSAGAVQYREIQMTCGAAMSKPFYAWLKGSIDGKNTRKTGAIALVGPTGSEVGRQTFNGTALTAIEFPSLDASKKDVATLSLTLAPESTRRMPGKPGPAARGTAPRTWNVGAFRLGIAGLEESARAVSRIEPISVRLGPDGDVSNLVFFLPAAQAGELTSWYEDFLLKGNNSDAQKKSGSLEFLSPDQKTVLFVLSLRGLGVVNLAPESAETAGEGERQLRAELFVESVAFDAP